MFVLGKGTKSQKGKRRWTLTSEIAKEKEASSDGHSPFIFLFCFWNGPPLSFFQDIRAQRKRQWAVEFFLAFSPCSSLWNHLFCSQQIRSQSLSRSSLFCVCCIRDPHQEACQRSKRHWKQNCAAASRNRRVERNAFERRKHRPWLLFFLLHTILYFKLYVVKKRL